MKVKLLFLVGMAFCGRQWAVAQDMTRLERLYEASVSRYMDSVSNRATIYSGKLQEPIPMSTVNRAYFKGIRYMKSKIYYGGSLYTDIPLGWNIYLDELIVLSPDNYHVVLKPDKTEDAALFGYHIRYLIPDSLSRNPPPAGYYLLLYDGHCTVFAKPAAVLQQRFDSKGVKYYFNFVTNYYIKKENVYYPIKDKNSLLNALGDYHQELSRLIRTNKFHFKRDAETLIVATVIEYEKLKDLP